MGATTPKLGLYKPGGGSSGLILPDEVVDVDRLNDNSDKIDAFASDTDTRLDNLETFQVVQNGRNQQFTGLAADINSANTAGRKLGDTYQETDGAKRLWEYDGAAWVTAEAGMYLIRPSSVVNATLADDGSIIPTHGAAANVAVVSLNDIFSTRFKSYHIEYVNMFSAVTNTALRGRFNGADLTGNDYTNQEIRATGTTVVAGSSLQAYLPVSGQTMNLHAGGINIRNTHVAGVPKFIEVNEVSNQAGLVVRQGYIGLNPYTMTGISFFTTVAANWVSSGGESWFKVYGLA